MPKQLQPNSKFACLDKNGDGVIYDEDLSEVADPYSVKNIIKKYDLEGTGKVTQEEMDVIERIIELESRKAKEEDRDKREDAQRRMAWFALLGMLLYPVGIMISDLLNLEQAANLLSSIAPTYFVAIAGLVAAFFGVQAWSSKKNDD
jgi:Ca2+-binding EF-hand superfamily protein